MTCIRFFAVLLLLAFPTWSIAAEPGEPAASVATCDDELSPLATLTEAQKAALRTLNRGFYSVRVLTKTIADVVRTVVLVGEIHFKSPADEARGRSLVGLFKDRAQESGPSMLAGFWFSRDMLRLIEGLSTEHRAHLNTQHDFTRNSSMHDSSATVVVRQLESIGIHNAQVAMREGKSLEEQITFLRSNTFQKFLVRRFADRPGYDHLVSLIDNERMVAAVQAWTPESPEIDLADAARPREVIDLEQGYEPQFTDQVFGALWVWSDRAKFATGRAAFGVGALLTGLGTYLDAPTNYAVIAVGLSVLAVRSALLLGREHGYRETVRNLPARDAHMAKRLHTAIADDPEITDTLVIVGDRHGEGIARELEQAGFESHLYWPMPVRWVMRPSPPQ